MYSMYITVTDLTDLTSNQFKSDIYFAAQPSNALGEETRTSNQTQPDKPHKHRNHKQRSTAEDVCGN